MKLKLLWYCTKNKPYLQVNRCVLPTEYDRYILDKEQRYSAFGEPLEKLNGKIMAESDFEVEEIANCGTSFMFMKCNDLQENYMYTSKVASGSCLNFDALKRYFGTKNGYAIHIKNLEIFDKPKELNEFYSHDDSYDNMFGCFFEDRPKYIPLKKAPRNMKYVYNKDGSQRYILISSHPECMAQILKGFRTIDLRKKILKEMLWHDCKA